MTRACLILWTFSWILPAVTIDRIAVVVSGKRAIKTSDIERSLRITQFLNGEPLDVSGQAKKQALSRLIDQELIRRDMALVGNVARLEDEPKELLDQIRNNRFGGSKEKLDAELTRYGLTESQLLERLEWQLIVLRFIGQRFKPGIVISPNEVRTYHEKHLPELKRTNEDASLEALSPKIRDTLEAEEVDRNFESWLETVREHAEIEYKVDELK